jgi:ABC-2 type transport system ATP-binding protein
MLQFQNFQKKYGAYPALQVPDTTLQPGIYWVKGINGSGKSTLLKSIAGVIPFSGDILLDDQFSLKRDPVAYRKRVNFSEAEPLFPNFVTGTELARLFLSSKGGEPGLIREHLEEMGMQTYIEKPVGTYSSGMTKKLSLLLSFIGQPSVILLDEPLITMDVSSISVLYEWINRYHSQQGVTFLLSSHQELDRDQLPGARELNVEHQTLVVSV